MHLFLILLFPLISVGDEISVPAVSEFIIEPNVPDFIIINGVEHRKEMREYLNRIRERKQPLKDKINGITIMDNYIKSYHLNHEKYQNFEEKMSDKLILKSKRNRIKRSSSSDEQSTSHDILKFALTDTTTLDDVESEKMIALSNGQQTLRRSKKDMSMSESKMLKITHPTSTTYLSSATAKPLSIPPTLAHLKSIDGRSVDGRKAMNNILQDKIDTTLRHYDETNVDGKRLRNGFENLRYASYAAKELQKNYYIGNKIKQNILSNKLNSQLDQIRSKRLYMTNANAQLQQYQPHVPPNLRAMFPQYVKMYPFTSLDQPFKPSPEHPLLPEELAQSHAQQQQEVQQQLQQELQKQLIQDTQHQHQQIEYIQHNIPKTTNFNYIIKEFQNPTLIIPHEQLTATMQQYTFPQMELYTANQNYLNEFYKKLQQQQQQQQQDQLVQQQQQQDQLIQQQQDQLLQQQQDQLLQQQQDQLLQQQQDQLLQQQQDQLVQQQDQLVRQHQQDQQVQHQQLQLQHLQPQQLHIINALPNVEQTLQSKLEHQKELGVLSSLLGKTPEMQLDSFNKLLQESNQLLVSQQIQQRRPQDSTSPVKFPNIKGQQTFPPSTDDNIKFYGLKNIPPVQFSPKDHTPITEQSEEVTHRPISINVVTPSSLSAQSVAHTISHYATVPPPTTYYPHNIHQGILSDSFKGYESYASGEVTVDDNSKSNNNINNHNNNKDLQYASGYAFGYRVRDYHTGNDFGHTENLDMDGITRGEYHILLPDGRLQNVRYTADDEGFHADVSYENVH